MIKNPTASARYTGDEGSITGSGRPPLEQGMATHSRILAWRIHGQRSLAGYSPWGHKESDMTEVTQHVHRQAGAKARVGATNVDLGIISI